MPAVERILHRPVAAGAAKAGRAVDQRRKSFPDLPHVLDDDDIDRSIRGGADRSGGDQVGMARCESRYAPRVVSPIHEGRCRRSRPTSARSSCRCPACESISSVVPSRSRCRMLVRPWPSLRRSHRTPPRRRSRRGTGARDRRGNPRRPRAAECRAALFTASLKIR